MKTLCALGAIALLAACSSGNGVQVNTDGSTTINNAQGTATVGGTTMPADWPTDAPTYAGAKVQYSMSTNPATGKAGSAVILATSDSVDAVAAFYAKALADNGWKIEGNMRGGGTTIMGATKDDRIISLAIANSEGMTTITMGIGKK